MTDRSEGFTDARVWPTRTTTREVVTDIALSG